MSQAKLLLLILAGLASLIVVTNANVTLNRQLLQAMNILPETDELIVRMKNISKIDPDAFALYNESSSLDLSLNIISDIDEKVLRNLPNIFFMDLSFNRLTTLQSNTFSNQKSLIFLKLNDNRLTSLPIFTTPTLGHLDLNKNYLTTLPHNFFSSLKNLAIINLSSNRLDKIDSNLFNDLTALHILDLSNNLISSLSNNIFRNLKSLTILDLRNNKLVSLGPNDFSGLSSLKSLDLSSNNLTSIADFTFSNSSMIRDLKLNDNKLSTLTAKTFAGLNKTRISVDLRNNRLSQISNGALQFMKFSSLLLSNNQLSMNFNMSGFNISEELDLSSNKITGVTDLYLTNDSFSLVLNNNAIESFNSFSCFLNSGPKTDDSFGISILLGNNKLKHLSIHPKRDNECISKSSIISFENNMIESVNISNLKLLEDLQMSYNKLSSLRANSFSNLTSLKYLSLRNNNISKLSPGWISGVSNIETIDLSFNSLSSLEASWFNGLKTLKDLFLESNSIKIITTNVFTSLTNLKSLYLSNNNLTSINGLKFESNIVFLNLDYNQISSINFSSITGIQNLRYLRLSNNKITSLNSTDFDRLIFSLLDLNNNPLKSYDFNNFTGFFLDLKLSNVGLNTSSAIRLFNRLKNIIIRSVDLSRNKIDELGPWLHNDSQLNTLDLSSNLISRIQNKTFESFKNLYTLKLANNQLTSINADMFKDLIQLSDLDLSGNKIISISDYAFRGVQLTISSFNLNISNNKLTRLNKNTFTGIKFQDLYSEFEFLTDSSRNNDHTKLDLSGNQLSTIDPNAFSEFGPYLNVLNLMNNSLGYLDTSMFLPMINLSYLALSGNRVFDNQTGANNLKSLCLSCIYGLPKEFEDDEFKDNFFDFLN